MDLTDWLDLIGTLVSQLRDIVETFHWSETDRNVQVYISAMKVQSRYLQPFSRKSNFFKTVLRMVIGFVRFSVSQLRSVVETWFRLQTNRNTQVYIDAMKVRSRYLQPISRKLDLIDLNWAK